MTCWQVFGSSQASSANVRISALHSEVGANILQTRDHYLIPTSSTVAETQPLLFQSTCSSRLDLRPLPAFHQHHDDHQSNKPDWLSPSCHGCAISGW